MSDEYPLSYRLAKYLQSMENDIYRTTNATLLRISLHKYMSRRPFKKEDYVEMYAEALKLSANELLCLSDVEMFEDFELEEFDRIVQENINDDSALSRTIKNNPGMSGLEILALYAEANKKEDVV